MILILSLRAAATTYGLEVQENVGGFGPQAQELVRMVVEWAGNVRDVTVFGYQTALW
jgi:hypothetical protein